MNKNLQHATRATRAGIDSDTAYGAVIPPIYLSSTFTFDGYDTPRQYDYTRSGNPTRDVLGQAIADLEEGSGGIVTGSGMSAICCVLQLLQPSDLLIVPHDCYGGSWRLFNALSQRGCFRLQSIDFGDAAARNSAFEQDPAMVWLETPSNPLLRVVDIELIARELSCRDTLLVVDNTFLSPALQQPIKLGADIVVHSTTKYLNGHSDVVGGAVVSRDPALHETLSWWANCLGVTGSPFNSFLTLRGLRTLAARMVVHQHNAAIIAELLSTHSAVSCVHYPGLASHPGHAIAARQQQGAGAMVSFELRGGDSAVRAFLEGLQCFSLAESLGGVESLVAHPATMTHKAMAPEARVVAGISDSLLRLSIGIEDSGDLCDDIIAGLARADAVAQRRRTA